MGNIHMDITAGSRADSELSNQCLAPVNLGKIKSPLETDVKLVHERFIWNSSDRDGGNLGLPEVGDEQSKPTLVLPVIDLKNNVPQDASSRQFKAREIGRAAEEFGFFQVRNHGIPKALIEKMLFYGKEFFELPLEVKERALNRDPKKNGYYQGYRGKFQHIKKQAPWLELLGENEHPVSEVDTLARAIWPESNGNPSFCLCVREYSEALDQLGRQILELLAEYLGLQSDYFSKQFAEGRAFQSNWRFNYYPVCPRPDLVLGVAPHTDPNALTILTQNEVAGFQLRKDDFWFDVKPAHDDLLINIGDTLQAWTHGKFRSSLHRAVLNDQSPRLSIIYFLSPPEGTVVRPPSFLVDSENSVEDPLPAWSHKFRPLTLYPTESRNN